MSKFTLKTRHAKEQLDYGERMGYDQLILAINKEDSTDGHYVSSMDLRRALEYLQKKVATLESRDRSTWMKGSLSNYPHLPLPPAELFSIGSNANSLKSFGSKQLNWLLEPLKLKRGEGVFGGWDYEVDKASLVYSGGELVNLPSQSVSLSMLIDWSEMRNMSSLSSGNAKALKKSSGVKKWVSFCKVMSEIIFHMVEEDLEDWYHPEKLVKVAPVKKQDQSKKVSSTKKVTATNKVAPKKNPFINSDSESDFEPFTQKTPVTAPRAKAVETFTKKVINSESDSDFEPFTQKTPPPQPRAKSVKTFTKKNVVSKLKKPERVRGGGADFDLHMGLALSISAEEERTRVDAMQLEVGENSATDISFFDPQPDQHLAGKLVEPLVGDDQELRIRERNMTQDLFSDLSSVASPHRQSIFSPPLQANDSPQASSSLLIDDLDLSELSGEDETENEKVRVKNVTSSTLLEDQINASVMEDISRLEEKAKIKNKLVKRKLNPVPYLPPNTSREEEEGEEEEVMVEKQNEQTRTRSEMEDDLKLARKAGLKPGIIKAVLESYCRFQTPINFQLIDKKLGANDQWHVILSDGKIKHIFVMSSNFHYVMTKIRNNSILCLNQIRNMKTKKSVPQKKMKVLLVTNFFVPTAQQVDYKRIGSPKMLQL